MVSQKAKEFIEKQNFQNYREFDGKFQKLDQKNVKSLVFEAVAIAEQEMIEKALKALKLSVPSFYNCKNPDFQGIVDYKMNIEIMTNFINQLNS